MEQDLALLQNISDTLKNNPKSSQRELAKNANVSLGMMNTILSRFVERGWIMLTNINARKLAYAITSEGISELVARSNNYIKRTFSIVNKYNEIFHDLILEAKNKGKTKIVLYGKSYIDFLISYICKDLDMPFEQVSIDSKISNESYCIVGEQENIKLKSDFSSINIIDLLGK